MASTKFKVLMAAVGMGLGGVIGFAGGYMLGFNTGRELERKGFQNRPAAVETIHGKERADIPFNGGKGVATGISITSRPIAKKPATIMEALEAVQKAQENAMGKCDAQEPTAADALDAEPLDAQKAQPNAKGTSNQGYALWQFLIGTDGKKIQ